MKLLKIIYLFLMLPVILEAGGSVYTRFGMGDLYHSFTARRLGIGELGIAVPDVRQIGTLNPAGWHKLNLTRFEFGFDFNGINVSSNAGSVFRTDYSFTGFSLGFPVERDLGITFVGGLTPVSSVDYEVVTKVTDPIAGEYTATLKGNGGLSKIYFGSTYLLPYGIAFGASFEYYTGKIDYSSESKFSSTNFSNSGFTTVLKNRGIGYTIGLMTSDLAEPLGIEFVKNLRLAAFFNSISELNTDTALTISSTVGSAEVETGNTATKVPSRMGVGMSFYVSDHYLILFDYYYQPWSKFEYNGKKSAQLQDLTKFSAGFEYSNTGGKFSTLWEQIIYRGGLSFEQTQYKINNKGINQYSIYGGLSFPLSIGNTIDLGFQAGIRGTKELNLLKENFYKVSVSLSFGELWFIRQER